MPMHAMRCVMDRIGCLAKGFARVKQALIELNSWGSMRQRQPAAKAGLGYEKPPESVESG